MSRTKWGVVALAGAVAGLGLAACGSSTATDMGTTTGSVAEVRLGYFPNLTHATPIVGVAKGFYTQRLGATKLSTTTFNAGPAEIEALLAGELDAAYIGPSPAINTFVKTHGEAIRIVAGAASGGAALVVRPGITTPADLKGKSIATPQLGNTQDVALRAWLTTQGLTPSSASVKGDVNVVPTDNATTLQLFKDGKLDGGWVPEPWASRLVLDGGGTVLVDERTLWPKGQFVTTHLLVRTEFLARHPQAVRALVDGQIDANGWIAKNPADAKTTLNAELRRITGKSLKDTVLDRAFANLTLTNDPIATSLQTNADHAVAAGLIKKVDLTGIYDLRVLNAALAARGLPAVSDAGLGAAG
ncbi:MAG TPA: ABC transporter substrate-binding protein [Mycobacteriales bacterium]|nr:ABC transporter substrate-binding protein [Mycobacteriales bacterium]